MLNINQQAFLKALEVNLYVPRSWVPIEEQRLEDLPEEQSGVLGRTKDIAYSSSQNSTGNGPLAPDSFQPALLDEKNDVNVKQSTDREKATTKANAVLREIVQLQLFSYSNDEWLFLDQQSDPRVAAEQQRLVQNMLAALGIKTKIKQQQLSVEVNTTDLTSAREQLTAYFNAQDIKGEKRIVLMGKAIVKLLGSQDSKIKPLGRATLHESVINWQSNSVYSAVIIPGSLMMLKDTNNKRIAWDILKQNLN